MAIFVMILREVIIFAKANGNNNTVAWKQKRYIIYNNLKTENNYGKESPLYRMWLHSRGR